MKLKLTDVRLSFPDLHEPVEYQVGDGKPRYNASFLVVPGSANDKAINTAITEACNDVFEKKADKMLESIKGNPNKFCYLDGDTKEYDGYAGMMVLAAHRRAKDGPVGVYLNVIDPQTGKVAVAPANCGKPYAGCYVNASVEIYAQKGENPGVRCGLIAVQFARDGDSFSGSKPATPDDFEPIEGTEDAGDLT